MKTSSNNPFDIKTNANLYALYDNLNNNNTILSFESFEYIIDTSNSGTSEIFNNVNAKILYLITGYNAYNGDGATRTLGFYRTTPNGNTSYMLYHTIGNTTSLSQVSKVENFLCNRVLFPEGLTNVNTKIIVSGFRIVLK